VDDATLTLRVIEALATIPGWSWSTGQYPAGATAIFYGPIPEGTYKAAIGVRVYASTDDNVQALHTRSVQLRFRGEKGKKNGADKLAHPAFLTLTRLSREGGISGVSRLSQAPLGADENGREERTDNYIITLDNTEATS